MLTLVPLSVPASAEEDATDMKLDPAVLESDGVAIGEIVLEKSDIFDLSDPRENNWFYRLANKYHIITKDSVIKKQILLEPGDPYSKRLADESERILRRNIYLYDAAITPINRRNGTVDLLVETHDVWTLKPTISFSRKGGENKTNFGIEELNLFGRGQTVRIEREDDVDRVSEFIEFQDPHLGRSWTSLSLLAADNSDGHSNFASLIRPFYALDTRWAAGATVFDDDRRRALYELGDEAAEYQHKRGLYTGFGGWSAGLRDGWVKRYTAGFVYDDNLFSDVVGGTLPAAVPADRKLVYPFFGIEVIEDQFETASNKDQIAKTEDFFTGSRFSATLGWADESFGADRDALLYSAGIGHGFGALDSKALLVSAWASGRAESGNTINALVGFEARYFHKQSERRLFFATMRGVRGHSLDLDNVIELGGDTGLRGYPLRYQSGDASFLLTVEQRWFSDWYPFRLFRVGAAIFADAGRTWGDNPVGGPSEGWLRDVGIGLRFAPTRSGTNKIIHVDIAFPLDGDASIDEVQILLESKKGF